MKALTATTSKDAALLNERGFVVHSFSKEITYKPGSFRSDGNSMSSRTESRYQVACKSGKVVFTGTHKAFKTFTSRVDVNGTFEHDLDY